MRRFLSAIGKLLRQRSAWGSTRARLWRRRRQYEPDLAILRLEPRRLLNADFGLAADALQLDFTDPAAADTLTISRDGSNLKFELDAGQFSGPATPGITGAGTDTLRVDITIAGGLTGGIQVLDQGDLGVELLAADFGGLTGGLQLVGIDSVTGDSGPFAVPQLSIMSNAGTPFQVEALDIAGDLSITSASAIDDFAGSGMLRVSGDLTVTAGVLPGDYNGDLIVDAGDYTVWRTNLGATSPTGNGPGDGNGDGVTDAADYTIWRDSLGQTVDAGTSTIDLGVGLDMEVSGTAKFESRGGGDINIGAVGAARDSGRSVEVGELAFQTTGDVQVIEDSGDGLTLAVEDFDGDLTPDANRGDDVSIRTAGGGVQRADLTVTDLTVTSALFINDSAATPGGLISVSGDAHLQAAVLPADFNGDGAVTIDDYAVWQTNFGQMGDPTNLTGDANNDGVTDLTDYTVWRDTLNSFVLPAGGEIVLGSQADLLVGDLATFETRALSGITVGVSLNRSVELGRVRFATAGQVSIVESSADGIELDRSTTGLAGQGSTIFLNATAGGIVLDSLDANSLNAFSAGAVTDKAGAQITVANLIDISTSSGDVVLADDPTDLLTTDVLLLAADDLNVGLAGAANFGEVSLTGDDVAVREGSSAVLNSVSANTLEYTAAGSIENLAAVTILGDASFVTTAAGSIDLDQLRVADRLSLETTDGNAAVNSEVAIEFGASNIAGNLLAIAATENITDTGVVSVAGSAEFATLQTDAAIMLDQLAVIGPIALQTVGVNGDAAITNATTIDFGATSIGGDLSATAVTGDISNTVGAISVAGAASFATPNGNISLGGFNAFSSNSLSLTGQIATVTDSGAVQVDQIDVDMLTLTAAGGLLSDLTGASVVVTGDASLTSSADIVLADQNADVLEIGGLASFTVMGRSNITIGPAGLANFGALSLSGNVATVQEDSTTVLQTIAVGTLNLTTEGLGDNSNIVIFGDANFVSAGDIILADNPGDILTIIGDASFTSGGDIELGLGGNANFGTL
ncbi:MAG: hypothetical protein AAGF31_09160, partial [Planctomycetota bacterium]